MTEINLIGIDLAKNIFHLHGVDASGATVVELRKRRAGLELYLEKLPPCTVVMESCGTSNHCPGFEECYFGACRVSCNADDECPAGKRCASFNRCVIVACTAEAICPVPLFGCDSQGKWCVRVNCTGGESCPSLTTCVDGLCIEDHAL